MRFEGILLALLGVNRHGWIHHAISIEAKKDGAVKTMLPRENASHHGHRLFAAVFLICGDQDDMLAQSGTFASQINQPLVAFRSGMLCASRNRGRKKHDEKHERKRHELFFDLHTKKLKRLSGDVSFQLPFLTFDFYWQ